MKTRSQINDVSTLLNMYKKKKITDSSNLKEQKIRYLINNSGEVPADFIQGIEASLVGYKHEKYKNLLKKYDIGLMRFNEDDFPEKFDEAVNILAECLRNTESSLHTLIKESGITYHDMAYYIYSNLVVTVEGNDKSGTIIPLKDLLFQVENITSSVAKLGLKKIKLKDPLFFLDK
jgi:plasmid maintenance system antidote protein VapI